MLEFIRNNISSIIVFVILAIIVGLIIYKQIKDHKQGKSSCGCGCSGCSGCSACQDEKKK